MVSVDVHARTPLYQQVMDQLLSGIAQGIYPPGEPLPSLRQAAVDTGLNINTVKRAYRELEQLGVLASFPGRGSVVCAGSAAQNAMRQNAVTQLESAAQNARLRGVSLEQVNTITANIFERSKNNA